MIMGREVIPGETVPLEVFPVELKERAGRVALRALALSLPVPRDVQDILDATDAELRAVQLTENKQSFDDLNRLELTQQERLGIAYGLGLAGRKSV